MTPTYSNADDTLRTAAPSQDRGPLPPRTHLQEALGYLANEHLLWSSEDVKQLWKSSARDGLSALGEAMVNGWGSLRFTVSQLGEVAAGIPALRGLEPLLLVSALKGAGIIRHWAHGHYEVSADALDAAKRVEQAAVR